MSKTKRALSCALQLQWFLKSECIPKYPNEPLFFWKFLTTFRLNRRADARTLSYCFVCISVLLRWFPERMSLYQWQAGHCMNPINYEANQLLGSCDWCLMIVVNPLGQNMAKTDAGTALVMLCFKPIWLVVSKCVMFICVHSYFGWLKPPPKNISRLITMTHHIQVPFVWLSLMLYWPNIAWAWQDTWTTKHHVVMCVPLEIAVRHSVWLCLLGQDTLYTHTCILDHIKWNWNPHVIICCAYMIIIYIAYIHMHALYTYSAEIFASFPNGLRF